MPPIFCTQGHENVPGNRYCYLCGEQLPVTQTSGIMPGLLLGDRYRMRHQLGRGGFGRTYLAEDIHRYNELCLLKEFAPQVRGISGLQKAEELFEREAGVLYQLNHPQIPRFRELFRAMFEAGTHLFLVQDYVQGATYRQILEQRRRENRFFTEFEVRQLLTQLLPVLHYIHQAGVIHRDISPDNLILREYDQLPVLIDFGGVKQVAVEAAEFANLGGYPLDTTRLGKHGYAPDEQLHLGNASPAGDLYALGMTVLVLLTGREPNDLLSQGNGAWEQYVTISTELRKVLRRMLAPYPGDRFQSAREVMQALGMSVEPSPVGNAAPRSLPPTPPALTRRAASPTVAVTRPRQSDTGALAGLLVLMLLVGAGLAWWLRDRWLPLIPPVLNPQPGTSQDQPSTPISADETERKAAITQRTKDLGVDSAFLISLTNGTFYQRYPEQQGRTLTTDPKDAEWRSRWDAIASDWLDRLDTTLTPDARKRLGQYGEGDRNGWKQTINQLHVGSRALNDLADARFRHSISDTVNPEDVLNQPLGQIWQAIAADAVAKLKSGEALDELTLESGQLSQTVDGTLNPGDGAVYIALLNEGQSLRVNLKATSGDAQFSIYLPRPTAEQPVILEDSAQFDWSGELPQSGYYEFVVVSRSEKPVPYEMTVAIDAASSSTESLPEAKS